MITNQETSCCQPQKLKLNSLTGYLSISDGNQLFLGTVIKNFSIKTPVIDYTLQGYISTLTYTDGNGLITSKQIDLSAIALGGSFTVIDTASLHLDYTAAVLTGDVKISADAGNSTSIHLDGIYSPTFTETPLTAAPSATVLLTPGGTDGHQLRADAILSANLDQQIQIVGDGLYVPNMRTYILQGTNTTITGTGIISDPYVISSSQTFVETPISVVDTTTVHLSVSGLNNHTVTAAVKVSATGGNVIQVNADGLYVPTTLVYTDAMARAAISATAPIAYNSGTGVLSLAQATSSVDGFLFHTDWSTFNNKISGATSLGTGSPVFAGVSGTTLQFNNILAGSNISITSAAGDITISAPNPPPSNNTFELFFIVGDGGTHTPANGASFFTNPLLVGATILGMWVEGIKIASVPRSGVNIYFTFASGSGQVTLTNGTFDTDGYYSIIYK